MSEMLRHFTHITIPAEIWLNRDLSLQAKALWAEIRSLHDPNAGGCYASDEYLCEFMNLKRSRLHEVFKELKENNLMDSKFDGRRSIRRALLPTVPECQIFTLDSSYPENRTADVRKTGQLSYIENKVLEESNITHPTQFSYPTNAASAAGVGVPLSSSALPEHKPPIPKPLPLKKEKHLDCVMLTAEEFTKLLALYGKEILDWLLEELNTYVGSSGKKYASHYHVLQKRGWVYKRYLESKAAVKNGYQRSGKLVIEADKIVQPTEREKFKVTISDEEIKAYEEKAKKARQT